MKRKAAKPRTSEHQEQVALFQWADTMKHRWPELGLMYANVNAGKRSYAMANWYKAEGLRSGVPDLFLPCARGVWFGFFCEMKAGKNKVSPEQRRWLNLLGDAGYFCVVCWSAEQAIERLTDYLNMPLTCVLNAKAAPQVAARAADEALGSIGRK